jgi:hypothetical protein
MKGARIISEFIGARLDLALIVGLDPAIKAAESLKMIIGSLLEHTMRRANDLHQILDALKSNETVVVIIPV